MLPWSQEMSVSSLRRHQGWDRVICSMASGPARDRGCSKAQGGQGDAEGRELRSSVLLGMLRQWSEGEMLQVSSSIQLLQSRLSGPELGAAAPGKVHFGFNLIKRINNYQLSEVGFTTIPSAEAPSLY